MSALSSQKLNSGLLPKCSRFAPRNSSSSQTTSASLSIVSPRLNSGPQHTQIRSPVAHAPASPLSFCIPSIALSLLDDERPLLGHLALPPVGIPVVSKPSRFMPTTPWPLPKTPVALRAADPFVPNSEDGLVYFLSPVREFVPNSPPQSIASISTLGDHRPPTPVFMPTPMPMLVPEAEISYYEIPESHRISVPVAVPDVAVPDVTIPSVAPPAMTHDQILSHFAHIISPETKYNLLAARQEQLEALGLSISPQSRVCSRTSRPVAEDSPFHISPRRIRSSDSVTPLAAATPSSPSVKTPFRAYLREKKLRENAAAALVPPPRPLPPRRKFLASGFSPTRLSISDDFTYGSGISLGSVFEGTTTPEGSTSPEASTFIEVSTPCFSSTQSSASNDAMHYSVVPLPALSEDSLAQSFHSQSTASRDNDTQVSAVPLPIVPARYQRERRPFSADAFKSMMARVSAARRASLVAKNPNVVTPPSPVSETSSNDTSLPSAQVWLSSSEEDPSSELGFEVWLSTPSITGSISSTPSEFVSDTFLTDSFVTGDESLQSELEFDVSGSESFESDTHWADIAFIDYDEDESITTDSFSSTYGPTDSSEPEVLSLPLAESSTVPLTSRPSSSEPFSLAVQVMPGSWIEDGLSLSSLIPAVVGVIAVAATWWFC